MTLNYDRILRGDIEAFVATIANRAPTEAAPTLVTFDEIGLEDGFFPEMLGFVAHGLDAFAAHHHDAPKLAGRPTIAVGIGRIARRIIAREGNPDNGRAMDIARAVALHELAHAITRGPSPPTKVPPAEFGSWIREVLLRTKAFDPDAHGPRWWRAYSALMARAAILTPDELPLATFLGDVAAYGFGCPTDGKEWIVAATQARGFLDCPLAEITSPPCPRFDELVAARTHEAGTSPAAA
jgi:hypothetical protein